MNPMVVPCGMSLSSEKKPIDTTKFISIDLTLSLTNKKRTFNILFVADEGCCNCCIVIDCILTVLESWWTVLKSWWTVLESWWTVLESWWTKVDEQY